jgi:polyisoprenyl-teichoic acid--peptidoglycan teichoic acid transferase
MRRSLMSIGVGIVFGLLACLALLATLAVIQPDWLNQMLAAATPTALPLPTATLSRPKPSAIPRAATLPPASPSSVVAGTCGGPARMTIALLGVDDRSQDYNLAARTDAISLVSINFITPTASLLSFPRDLYVPLPNLDNAGITQDRLNTAYEFGDVYKVPGGGPAEFKNTLEWNFGIRVDRYVLGNFGAFVSLVDALGGIEVDVPEAIYDPAYPDDNDNGTFIFSLPAGQQHMDGQTALRYARTRHQDDDYHREQRQQLVLLAIRNKLVSPQVVPQLPALIATLGHLVRTDLTPLEITSLACIGTKIDRSAITAQAIDGTMVIPWLTPSGAQVSIPNRDLIAPLVAKFLGQ